MKLPMFNDRIRRVHESRRGGSRSGAAASVRRSYELLRDPALWAWLLVALLAIFPARAVLAGP